MYTKNSKISFIVPAYNCSKTIEESIDSIFNGNFENGDEVIIVDDASTDNTKKILDDFKKKYPTIKILKHNINRGTAAAGRNTAIDSSSNNLIFTLDADNILVKGSVKILKEKILNGEADMVSTSEIWFFNDINNKVTKKWIFSKKIDLQYCLSNSINPCSTGNYLFTKKSWKISGRYFEPGIENQTLDSWTFGIRQLASGFKMITVPNTYYLHRTGINSHWIRENAKGNVSLSALIALIPFLELVEDEDREYIFSPEGRYKWFDEIDQKPLKIKNQTIEKKSKVIRIPYKQNLLQRIFYKLKKIIKSI